ncbi:MAG: hypothetical protein HYV27_07990 [Candidatus Hydrogenedentes bacterium]|nr:hypothetical protein [Candidatus Hydrogenedentota bacterium]
MTQRSITFAAAILGVAAAGMAVFLFGQLQNSEKHVARLEAEVTALKDDRVRTQPGAPAAATSSGAMTAPDPGVEAPSAEDAGNAEPLDSKALLSALTKKEDSPAQSPFAAVAAMYEGEQGKELARTSAQMSVNMQYGDLFKQLGLSPEAETQLREILLNHATDAMLSGLELMKGGDMGAATANNDELKLARDEAIRGLLSDEQQGVFEEYEEGLPRRMVEQAVDMQMGMFSTSLSEESREAAKEVMVEEMLGLQGQTENAPDIGANIDSQVAMYDRIEDRLAEVLSEEDLRSVQPFLAQQRAMMEAAAQMMGNNPAGDSRPE